jgi:hypothetical protein
LVYQRLDTSNAERSLLSGMGHLPGEDWRRASATFAAAVPDAEPDWCRRIGLTAARDRLNDRPRTLQIFPAGIAWRDYRLDGAVAYSAHLVPR